MGLFGFGKKERGGCELLLGRLRLRPRGEVEEPPRGWCVQCGNLCKVSDIEAKKAAQAAQASQSAAGVKVLGSGCAKCNQLGGHPVASLSSAWTPRSTM